MDVRNGKAIIYNGLEVSGSSLLTGTLNVTGGITGSLFGTASWAQNALTSSFITPTGTNAFVQNGNSFGTTALLGTNDNQNLQFETSGSVRVHIGNTGNVGIGTTSPSASLHISGANNQSLLRVSSPSASAALFVSGSGNVGVGTATPAGLIDIFQGGNSRILVTTDNGFVGLQQSSPAERIHITSDPTTGKYLQIDAALNATLQTPLSGTPTKGYGSVDDGHYLAEPHYWMEIKLNGTIVLIPCYLPA